MYPRIKKLRNNYSFTIEEISNYLEISPSLYSSYENGKIKVPIIILLKLSRKYNTSIDYLIGDTDVVTPHKKSKK